MIPPHRRVKQLLIHKDFRFRWCIGVLCVCVNPLTISHVEGQVFAAFPESQEQTVPLSFSGKGDPQESFQEMFSEPQLVSASSTSPNTGKGFVLPSFFSKNFSQILPAGQTWDFRKNSLPTPRRIAGVSSSGSLSPTVVFNAAYSDYLKGRYVLAISAFRQFLMDYSSSSRADQAHYYLGESYYFSGNISAAARTFRKLLEDFPRSRYGPSALLKLGAILAERGKVDKAKKVWLLIMKKFPRSPESQLAQQQILRHP